MSRLNPLNVVSYLSGLINEKFNDETPTSDSDKQFAINLFNLIESSLQSNDVDVEFYNTLDFDDDFDYVQVDDDEVELMDKESDSDSKTTSSDEDDDKKGETSSSYEPTPKKKKGLYTYAEKCKIVNYFRKLPEDYDYYTHIKNPGVKPRTIASMQNRFSKTLSIGDIYRFERQVKSKGDKIHKIRQLWQLTYQKMKISRQSGAIIHDATLISFASDIAQELGLNYKISNSWLLRFKRTHRIRSRKITKFVTTKNLVDKEAIENSAIIFVGDTKEKMEDYHDDFIFNTDQSSFKKELHSGGTLEFIGTKSVHALAQSMAALTHSYTIMPTISKSGKLQSPLFLCFGEKGGKVGPTVSVYQAPNIFVTYTPSGMMGNPEAKIWYQEVFLKHTGERNMLLHDAWSCFNHDSMDEWVEQKLGATERIFTFEKLPEHTTGLIQPLDLYCFRFWKNFAKQISDDIVLNYQDNLQQRNNRIKLQCLLHNQFSSPKFIDVFRYAWAKGGYTDEEIEFINPVQYCLRTKIKKCELPDCNGRSFIRCSWCEKTICYNHFWNNFGHYHKLPTDPELVDLGYPFEYVA